MRWLGVDPGEARVGIAACDPGAVRAQKALIREWERLPRDRAAEAGIPVFAKAFAGPEPRRRMRAFLDRRRKPRPPGADRR